MVRFFMNKISKKISCRLSLILPMNSSGAFNIRENGECAGRRSTPNIRIETKEGAPGLVIHISSEAQKETVYILPA